MENSSLRKANQVNKGIMETIAPTPVGELAEPRSGKQNYQVEIATKK